MSSEIDDSSRVDHVVVKATGRIRTLGEQTAFYGQALWNTPDAIRRYPTMVLRQIAEWGWEPGPWPSSAGRSSSSGSSRCPPAR